MFGGSKTSKIEKAVAKRNASVLIALAGEKDKEIRDAAIAGLGKVKNEDSYNALIAMLRSPDAAIRVAVADALADSGDGKARAHIDHMLSAETDENVKTALRKAIAKLHTNE